jgi:PAS domain S-box-containing protein
MPPAQPNDPHAAAQLGGLLESAMDAIVTVDQQQVIVLYNRAAEKVFGWPADQILGQPLERLLPARYRAQHAAHVRRFGDTGVTSRRMSGSTVVYGLRANGEEFPVDASISQVDTPEGKLFTVILRDVTERLRAEQQQARMAARLSGLIESAMDGIISIDEAQRITLFNRAAEKIFGWRAAQVIGQPLEMLLPPRFRAAHAAQVRHFGATGVTSRRMGGLAVIHGLRADGEEFPMDASISQVDTAEGKLYTVILRDVTERVRAQQELAFYAAEATRAREEEKSRVARELHDELAQQLTALKMDTIWLRDNAAGAPAAQSKITDMLALLDTSVAATRRIAADLRPLVLDDLGLVPAVEWLVQNFTQRHGVPCTLDIDEDLELGEPHATGVFRIVQESLANVAKHAGASRVGVRVAREGAVLLLQVQDDGAGFDPAAPRRPQSLGLAGLRERSQLLHGEVRIESAPGRGTRVEARVPLPQDDEGATP